MWLESVGGAAERLVYGTCLALILAGASVAPAAAQASGVEGSWATQGGAEITVSPCGTGYCGSLTWIVIPRQNAAVCHSLPRDTFASLMTDIHNPNKALQSRPLLGLQMMTMTPTNDPTSFNIKIYNAEDGSTNDAQAFVMNNGNTLRVGGGCVGTMCIKSQDWPRVPSRLVTPDFTCDGGR